MNFLYITSCHFLFTTFLTFKYIFSTILFLRPVIHIAYYFKLHPLPLNKWRNILKQIFHIIKYKITSISKHFKKWTVSNNRVVRSYVISYFKINLGLNLIKWYNCVVNKPIQFSKGMIVWVQYMTVCYFWRQSMIYFHDWSSI